MELAAAMLVRCAGDAMAGLFRHAPGFEARLTRESWLVASGEPHPLLNWIAVFGSGPAAEIGLRNHIASMRARGLPVLVFLTPAAGERFASLCSSLGLVNPDVVPLMTCRLGNLSPARTVDGLQIASVRDAESLRAGLGIFAAGFEMPVDAIHRAAPEDVLEEPPLEFVVATRQGETLGVVATSRFGPIVYVDLMATSRDHKRQGIGYALLQQVLAEHAAAGATDAFLIASDEGHPLYERLGFRVLFEATMWELPPTVAGRSGSSG